MKRNVFLIFFYFVGLSYSFSQEVLPLYSDSIPNSVGATSMPTITIYPAKGENKGAGVIIFPGGGYSFLATNIEGTSVAKAFQDKGITAFVVKYRLPNSSAMRDKSMSPLMDAQAAIKLVRMQSKEWKIYSDKIGIIGYSAGGHVASSLGTHFAVPLIPNSENISLRPDFMILVYPVISMDNPITHQGSRNSLLGAFPTMEKVIFFSNEEQVTKLTPPTYLTHCQDDDVVTVENSLVFYKALIENEVPVEMHLFNRGNHGFTTRQPIDEWLSPMLKFLEKQGIINKQ